MISERHMMVSVRMLLPQQGEHECSLSCDPSVCRFVVQTFSQIFPQLSVNQNTSGTKPKGCSGHFTQYVLYIHTHTQQSALEKCVSVVFTSSVFYQLNLFGSEPHPVSRCPTNSNQLKKETKHLSHCRQFPKCVLI